ncbi:MAG: HNH endonuclease, partial [Pseudobdellovibrionaceae bacterium]
IDLIEILQQVWVERSFYYFNCNSLFEYAVRKLHLSREVASIYNKIAKKALIIPGFKEQIKSGSISVSNANRICSVITPENKEKWFMLAQGSKLQLEKAVALASPKTAIRERAIARNIGDHVQMEIRFGTSEKNYDDLKRAQDILSQKLQRGATMDDVYSSALQLFLDKNDPLRKSCRVKTNQTQTQTQNQNDKKATSEIKVLGTMKSVGAARTLKITVTRAVHHKNESQCSHIDELGQRCQQRRHLHIHHIQPLSQGGTNQINNLIILCSGHHQAHHLGH